MPAQLIPKGAADKKQVSTESSIQGAQIPQELSPQEADEDIRGFGVNYDFAWDSFGLIGYHSTCSEKNARVLAGYRALSQDYTDGNGRDKFQWDVTLQGLLLGLMIGF